MRQVDVQDTEVLLELARQIVKLLRVDSTLIRVEMIQEFNFLIHSGIVFKMNAVDREQFNCYWREIQDLIGAKEKNEVNTPSVRPRF